MTADEIWARLSADDLVRGARPEPMEEDAPWFVRLMLGFAGWIGALFLLGFVAFALGAAMTSGLPIMLAGAGCCGVAFALFRAAGGHAFADQFALAISLAGQVLLAIGIGVDFDAQGVAVYLAIAAVEAVLAFLIPAFLHRLLAACGTAIALALAIGAAGTQGLAAPLLCLALAWVWLDPARWATGARVWRPVGYGLVLAVLMVEASHPIGASALFGHADAGRASRHLPAIGRALTGAVLVGTAAVLAMREGLTPGSRGLLLAVGAAMLIGAAGVLAPGLGAALLILLLGQAAGNRVLAMLGIAGLLGFAGHYYYSLHATLLVKSGVLAITGVGLLAASFFLGRDGSDADA